MILTGLLIDLHDDSTKLNNHICILGTKQIHETRRNIIFDYIFCQTVIFYRNLKNPKIVRSKRVHSVDKASTIRSSLSDSKSFAI